MKDKRDRKLSFVIYTFFFMSFAFYWNQAAYAVDCNARFSVTDDNTLRKNLVTLPSGMPIEISFYNTEQIEIPLTGAVQPEFERRYTFLPHSEKGVSPELFAEGILVGLLDRDHTTRIPPMWPRLHHSFSKSRFPYSENRFVASPLDSRYGQAFHVPMNDAAPSVDINSTDFRTEVNGREYFQIDERYSARSIYFVGRQRENSIYYDTPESDLQNQGYAIRVKRWLPGDGSTQRASTQGLFVKLTLKSDDLFTLRDEWHIKLPSDMKEEDIISAARALLLKAGAKLRTHQRLTRLTEIRNLRYGADIQYMGSINSLGPRLPRKVGFLTLDTFEARLLRDPVTGSENSGAWMPAISQIEYELLPTETRLIQTEHDELQSFFSEVESNVSGRLDPLPKYLQALARGQALLRRIPDSGP